MLDKMATGSKTKAALLGVPDHLGVFHVGGRVGASKGPAAFRKIWQTFKSPAGVREKVRDLGDVAGMGDDVRANLDRTRAGCARAHAVAARSLVVGGGNDHAFAQLAGVRDALSARSGRVRLGCINVDAHFDVRKPSPQITSGSPFYLALEERVVEPAHFVEFGIQAHCNAPELWTYIRSRKVRVVEWEDLRGGSCVARFKKELAALAKKVDAVVVCFDLDAVAQAFAPGVSAPQSEGLTAEDAIRIAEICGASSDVVSFGLYELNPEHDEGGKTARLAATLGWHWAMKL